MRKNGGLFQPGGLSSQPLDPPRNLSLFHEAGTTHTRRLVLISVAASDPIRIRATGFDELPVCGRGGLALSLNTLAMRHWRALTSSTCSRERERALDARVRIDLIDLVKPECRFLLLDSLARRMPEERERKRERCPGNQDAPPPRIYATLGPFYPPGFSCLLSPSFLLYYTDWVAVAQLNENQNQVEK